MWSLHHRSEWKDLDVYEEPTDFGRRLDVEGFILADPFDIFLRNISVEYLQAAWDRVVSIISQYKIEAHDLTWGAFHPGETHVSGRSEHTPLDFIGWSSRELINIDQRPDFHQIDETLKNGLPSLRCVITWRSLKWRFASDNFALGLRLVEAWSTDEIAFWDPQYFIQDMLGSNELWRLMAKAIVDNDQKLLDDALKDARSTYSPIGYKIVVKGYRIFLKYGVTDSTVQIPSEE
jgi:hypothetical protein